MSTKEMSDQFDVLFNNITSNQAPGLNEYEKSVFLTKAQDEIIKNYFNPKSKGNSLQEGFDGNPKRQADFSMLMKNVVLKEISPKGGIFDKRSTTHAYIYPEDLFISLNEQLKGSNNTYTIVPITYEEYNRLMSKPYKYPPKYQAWRLLTNNVIV